MVFGASDYLRKRMLQDAEKFISHFAFRPQKRLQTLHPFKVRNDDATSVTKNIRDHEHFVPALSENQICIGRGRTVGAFGKDAALKFACIFSGNHAVNRAGSENIAL